MISDFSEEVKKLLDKKPLTFPEMETLKKALIAYSEKYVDLKVGGNSSINLTNTFTNDIKVADANHNFILDIGRRMERSRNFKMIENIRQDGNYEIIVTPLDRTWAERNSQWAVIIGIILGSVLNVTVDVLKSQLEKQPPSPIYNIEDARIQPLYDSLSKLKTEVLSLQDTLKKYKPFN